MPEAKADAVLVPTSSLRIQPEQKSAKKYFPV
jgi:hypothetical protein